MTMQSDFSKLPSRDLVLSDFVDGCGYRVSSLKLSQPNLFTRLGDLGDLVVKVPSPRGRSDFQKYVKQEKVDPQDIRQNEDLERFGSLSRALEHYPGFQHTRSKFGGDIAHYLVVYRLQYDRIREARLVSIPETRFIVLSWPRRFFGWHSAPVIVQERISGIRLINMVEPMEGTFLAQYSELRPKLQVQLEPLVNSSIGIHIDWNIRNFIWQESEERLYYVDNKPTTLAAKWGVDRNLSSLREAFFE